MNEIIISTEIYGRIKLTYFRNGIETGYTEIANAEIAIREINKRMQAGWVIRQDKAGIVSPISTYTGYKIRKGKRQPYWMTYLKSSK